jgi:hypothetical protein
MKKQLTLFALLFLTSIAWAQNNVNLVIFSEDLEPFYAYVNGIKQNANPETNVRIAGIAPNIALRIEFVNKALPVIKQNMSLLTGFEHTARLKYDKNKVMKLRYFGQVPMEQIATDNAVSTVNYHTAELPAESVSTPTVDKHHDTHTTIHTMPVNSNVSITSSTVSTTTGATGGNGNGSINVSMPGGIGINMNVNDPNVNGGMQTTTSTTVTTSTSTSDETSTQSEVRNQGVRGSHSSPPPAPAPITAPTKIGCTAAMSDAAFSKMKATIESKPFSDTKMSTARVSTKNACLSVTQVMEIAKLFSMDEDRFAYAKYAYDFCIDKANYYQVSDVFSFSSTTDDFNKFLEK